MTPDDIEDFRKLTAILIFIFASAIIFFLILMCIEKLNEMFCPHGLNEGAVIKLKVNFWKIKEKKILDGNRNSSTRNRLIRIEIESVPPRSNREATVVMINQPPSPPPAYDVLTPPPNYESWFK